MQTETPLMIIENDSTDVMILKRVIKDLNYQHSVVYVKNTEDALDLMRLSTGSLPWLILLDLNLPKMGGLEFLQLVKSTRPFKWIPVVILTSSENPDDIINAARRGCCGYLLKEFDYGKFRDSIAATLNYWAKCLTPGRRKQLDLNLKHFPKTQEPS